MPCVLLKYVLNSENSIFHILIGINCNRISEVLLYMDFFLVCVGEGVYTERCNADSCFSSYRLSLYCTGNKRHFYQTSEESVYDVRSQ
jgi:hypothetical protein